MKEFKHQEWIQIRGAAVNNLKNIDLDIPRNQFTVITGLSGSGKSSLAFDTLFAEGQRRFAESISSFARQFLGRMAKPAVDRISGIPPAIAIEQKVNTRNPRSTVGTSTEIYDYLRLLFARIGRTYSPISGQEVTCDDLDTVLSFIQTLPANTLCYLTAVLDWEQEKYRIEQVLNLKEEGFSRLLLDHQQILRMDAYLSEPERYQEQDAELLVDRISMPENGKLDEDTLARLMDSIQTAFDKGNGKLHLIIDGQAHTFSTRYEADGLHFEPMQEWDFNYNNPIGACKHCGGLGKISGIDENLVVPDPNRSLYDDGIACWRGDVMKYFKEQVLLHAEKHHFPVHTPYRELTQAQKDLLWNGTEDFEGIHGFFRWAETKRHKIQFKYLISRYSGRTTCPECNGSRLKKEALYVRVGGKNIAELTQMTIGQLNQFFQNIQLSDYELQIAAGTLQELRLRLQCIEDVGLSYLTLSRASSTLSGGESQRINLVSSLGNSLTGSMYILDEPSIGLHPRDTQRLISVLLRLRDLGNTVIVVEHDEEIIRAADYLVDIGPDAGRFGGEIVYAGPVPDAASIQQIRSQYPHSHTLAYLEQPIGSLSNSVRSWTHSIQVCGAAENNLKGINVRFPLRVMTAVTGVSGSGKSSLVGDILYPALRRELLQMGDKPGLYSGLSGDLNKISNIEYVDQNPIGKSSRSNPATYLKIYDEIRKLYSDQPYAKSCGFGHSHFSFNIDGGRCPECLGEGIVRIPMQFMADIVMTCESCGGKRFLPEIIEVRYKGKDISEILDMSIVEAYDFFSAQPEAQAKRIAERLLPLRAVGLDYIKLGQSSSTLSGGESQRVKLAYFLSKDTPSTLFIFDEPTTGLHFADIEKLMASFQALLEKGHSIIVVEHNTAVIRAADWVIDLGPDGGAAGGEVVFEGTPAELAQHPELPTGAALAAL
ncbi:MAG: excinuclease ABC subunit UvrA [Bacteroidales bacterium]|nr:excinuclease ABC subunit UvrA [Bacteroidales bacterium]